MISKQLMISHFQQIQSDQIDQFYAITEPHDPDSMTELAILMTQSRDWYSAYV